ncbi:DUF6325 family protein [Microbacterium thalassium]|uniref:DUF1269 domain-containing protein n=1 Tax=Microbacterium thalassium TaxID=362649 RepID=A0A7X0KT68_9MICO|nr:DUF6325 family protein [Microbacterium thalassium]MBB6389794.1 hypothetical protein [Microbacterium thalassium]GLK24482.1 hypothetical protein GCM10017607_18000 [Microbacterium thalassium]
MNEELSSGPIDYLIVEWPAGSPPNGEAFPHLVDLVDRGLIRILDMTFVTKDEDGTVSGVAIGDFDLDGIPDLAVFEGVGSGLLGDDDVDQAGNALEPGTSGAILVYENTWAAPFATALRKSGAQLVDSGRIPVNAIVAALDELDAAEV